MSIQPILFRGLAIPGADQRVTAGKRMDGSYFIDIAGRSSARAYMTPQQTFELAKGLFRSLGYHLELGDGPQP